MGAQGKTTINFGAWPGAYDTTEVITGQTGILAASSLAEAWIIGEATADHSIDEHTTVACIVGLVTSDIVDNTGFTIRAVSMEGPMYGQFTIGWVWN